MTHLSLLRLTLPVPASCLLRLPSRCWHTLGVQQISLCTTAESIPLFQSSIGISELLSPGPSGSCVHPRAITVTCRRMAYVIINPSKCRRFRYHWPSLDWIRNPHGWTEMLQGKLDIRCPQKHPIDEACSELALIILSRSFPHPILEWVILFRYQFFPLVCFTLLCLLNSSLSFRNDGTKSTSHCERFLPPHSHKTTSTCNEEPSMAPLTSSCACPCLGCESPKAVLWGLSLCFHACSSGGTQ